MKLCKNQLTALDSIKHVNPSLMFVGFSKSYTLSHCELILG